MPCSTMTFEILYSRGYRRGGAKQHSVNVLPEEVSRIVWKCSLEDGALRIGFRYVGPVGEEIDNSIVRVRETCLFITL